MDINIEPFGNFGDKEVNKITLKNESDVSVSIINYGAIVQSVIMPDRFGTSSEVTLNYNTLKEYINDKNYLGATIGRYANRIKNGAFSIGGEQFQLSKNENGKNHLHGGFSGFNKKLWTYEVWKNERVASVRMKYISPDGEEGYPGNLAVEITFTLDDKNSFIINYKAVSDKKTPVNLTNHTYINLSGVEKDRTILGHLLKINSSFYVETDNEQIPTGKIVDVKESEMNFKEFRRIGDRIKETKGGYDDCYVFPSDRGKMYHALSLSDPLSGRNFELFTDKPGVQIYTANNIDPPYRAVCCETQNFPDSVNNPDFPNPFISPGDVYNRTVFCRFTISN